MHRAIPESLSAVVAATAVVVGLRMVSIATIGKILRSTRSDALTFTLTAAVTVCFDLIEAVEIGIVVAAFFALRTVARRSSVVREELPGPAGDERIVMVWEMRSSAPKNMAPSRRRSADAEHPEVSVVIIRMSQLGMLDATGAHTLAEIAEELEARGITVIIKGVQPEHRNLLATMGIFDALCHPNHVVDSLDEAVAHARSHVIRSAAAQASSMRLA